jgi:Polyketide cyclase / dehydrase and lipid transport
LLECERQAVWDALQDVQAWSEWWRGVVRVTELEPRERYSIAWRSRIPYDLEFEFRVLRQDAPHSMDGRATGDLEGSGHWRLFEHAGVTAVTYEWNIRTTKPWMSVLAPVARPIFEYNHNVVMRWGGEGLARRLGCRLLAAG